MSSLQFTIEIDEEVADALRARGLDPKTHAERLVRRDSAEREAAWRRWEADHAEGIAAYNARVSAEGLWSDGVRSF